MTVPTVERVRQALATVDDPEIHRPITELGMVDTVEISPDGKVRVGILLTIQGCPLRDKLQGDITLAIAKLDDVTGVTVDFGVMSDGQRKTLQSELMGDRSARVIPFSNPLSRTKIYAVASGKGGVGKSSLTVNLAVATARLGRSVGIVDADIYGHSIPRMLGVTEKPTQVGEMVMPPTAHGVRVISTGMFTSGNNPVVWRGPMLHRALEQFLAEVYWGDLDVLFLDLPPGTGDIALSISQLLPTAEILVVTTPQQAAAEVAERAGSMVTQTEQHIAGVIENMAWLSCPHCDERIDVFGSGGGRKVADALSRIVGAPVPLLGQIPLDVRLREHGDSGDPIVLADPDSPAAQVILEIVDKLSVRGRSLVGRLLGLTPLRR